MFFAAPWYLLGALGAVVPVLVHLFGRRKARRVEFAALRLVKAAQRERTSLVRLRQVWLMALRALAILLLSLALARPVLTGGHGEGVTVVVDDTLSMRARSAGRTAFGRAGQAASQLLEGMSGRQVRLVKASEREPHELSAREAAEAVRAMEPGYGAQGLGEAVRRTQGEVWVFTDMQKSAWAGAEHAQGEVTVVDCGREVENVGVRGVEMEGVTLAGEVAQVAVQADGEGEIEVAADGKLIGRAAARGGRAWVEFVPEKPGALGLAAKLKTDALREDDTGYGVVRVRDQLRALLVGTEAQTRYVKLALAPEDGGRVKVRVVPKASPEDRDWADVMAIWGDGEIAGPGLIAFTETMPDNDLAGLRLGKLTALPHPLRLGWLQVFHGPLASFSNPAAGDLQAVSFRAVRTAEVSGDWETLAHYEDATPAVLTSETPAQRRVIINLALDPERSDLVTQPAFVPLVHRLFRWAAQREFWELEGALAGTKLTLDTPPDATNLKCTGPEGADVPCRDRQITPPQPGLYRLTWTEGTTNRSGMFAVNTDPRESDLKRISESKLRQTLGSKARVVKAEEARAVAARAPRGLATPLFVLAFLILLAEMAIGWRRE